MTSRLSTYKKESKKDGKLDLKHLKLPQYLSHVKAGNSLCANKYVLLFQNGPTTIEIRAPPKFEAKQIPWHEGLLRDIIWSEDLGTFILLSQNSVFTFNASSITAPKLHATSIHTEFQLKAKSYEKIKPYNSNSRFWRCASTDKTLYICYSGLGTVIDEYRLESSSCEMINRWTSPSTCAYYEGIWCMRCHPNTKQIGMTIMNARDNHWRFEIRNRTDFSPVFRIGLPINHGDCELSSLNNGEWLLTNSCGIRFIHIVDLAIKVVVEYERELKNAVTIGNDYFVVRTKSTIEAHPMAEDDK